MFAKNFCESGDMDGRTRLAKAFEGHVKRMGWSQQHVAAIGGPSTTTQTKITHGTGPLSRQTCQKIDVAMGWPRGTAGRVAAGEIDPPAGNTEVAVSLAPQSECAEESVTATVDQDPQGRLHYRGVMQSDGHKVELTYTPPPGWGLKVVELIDALGQVARTLDGRAAPVATGGVSLPRSVAPQRRQSAEDAPAVQGASPASDSPDDLPDWLTLAANTDTSPTDRERFEAERGDWGPA